MLTHVQIQANDQSSQKLDARWSKDHLEHVWLYTKICSSDSSVWGALQCHVISVSLTFWVINLWTNNQMINAASNKEGNWLVIQKNHYMDSFELINQFSLNWLDL